VLILSLAVAVGFALLASYLARKPLLVKLGIAAPVIAAGVVGAVLLPSNAQIWQLVTGQAWPAYTELVREDANNVTILVADQKNFSIVVSGHFQGSFPFHLTHVHNGSMGSLVNRSPRRVLDIGFGSGASPYTAGLSPATDHITVVEIVKGIYEVQRTFSDVQESGPIYRMFRDPRYEFIAGDGRKYLASTRETFDVIIADPLRSVSSGSGFIFSEEYFRLVQSRLAPGGVMVQWIASPRVLAGFKRVFPYGVVFDTTAIGSNSPIVIDKERIRELLRDTKVLEYLRAGQIDVEKLVEFATSDPAERWSPADSRAGPPGNSDLFPRDEFWLGNTYQP
jgi:spermidine synthase